MTRASLTFVGLFVAAAFARGDDFDRPPINYSSAAPTDAVARLQKRLAAGEVKLKFEDEHGYLPAVLKALDVPVSSQTLVFSKTSMQRDRISPRTPRALYFNDEVYVGFCRLGSVLEIAATDPQLGPVYYTLDQEPAAEPAFTRQTENCLICHTARSQGTPAHVVRSVFTDRDGHPVLSEGSYRIDHTSPLEHRWGGWYVTGTHGSQTHLGNHVVPRRPQPGDLKNHAGLNVTDLKGRVDAGAYLAPHSDLVALMVLEHQAEMHNRLTAANYQTRLAHRDADVLNDLDSAPRGRLSEGTARRVDAAAEQLVQHLLFSGEAKLGGELKGTSAFATEFAARGPRDPRGRSLRDFDLKTRLFRYPCSYLIYSESFDALPASVKDRVYRRLWDVLTGKETGKDYAHLTPDDRQTIREILVATKKGLPDYWKE
jgi:hypothetical protein